MTKYARSLVHALYAALGIGVLFVATPAGQSFVQNHPALAAFVPLFVGLARALETWKRGN